MGQTGRLWADNGVAFETWDVFSGERLLGNQLAVFPDASGIPEARLAAVAREMAFSESTFVYPAVATAERQQGVRTRIFAKAGSEMQFAGHPVLGTAFALWSVNPKRTSVNGDSITLNLPVGPIVVEFRERAGAWEGEMTQPEPVFSEKHEAKSLAPLLGLRAEDFDAAFAPETVSTGRPNVLVMLKTREAVRRAAADWRGLETYFASGDKERGIYLLTRDVEKPEATFHARKPTRTGDDPVTGSAGGAAFAWFVKSGLARPGERVVMEQGSEVNRRGLMSGSAEIVAGKVTKVKVGGRAVRVITGTLAL